MTKTKIMRIVFALFTSAIILCGNRDGLGQDTLKVMTGSGEPGQQNVSVIIALTNSFEIGGFRIELEYDPGVLKFQPGEAAAPTDTVILKSSRTSDFELFSGVIDTAAGKLTTIATADFLPPPDPPLSIGSGPIVEILFDVDNAAMAGSNTLKIIGSISNADGTQETEPVFINGVFVVVRNHPPTIDLISDTVANEDELFELQVQASDPDDDALTFSLMQNPSWLTVNSSTGLLSGTPQQADVGIDSVKVQVDDGRGEKASTSFVLEVRNVNDPPEPFVLVAPANSEEVNTLLPVLRWQHSNDLDIDDAISYQLIVSKNQSFSDTTVEATGLSDTTYMIQTGLDDSQAYYWKVIAVDLVGAETESQSIFSFKTSATASEVSTFSDKTIPQFFDLSQNYPNPFSAGAQSRSLQNTETQIKFQLPRKEHVSIQVFNLLGKQIATIINEDRPPGRYVVRWHGRDDKGVPVPNGLYFLNMKAAGFSKTIRMIVLQ